MLRRISVPSILALILLVVAAGSIDTTVAQCAMCGTALQGEEDSLSRSIASSVLFMVSMPFAIVLSVAGWIVWRVRRHRHHPSLEQDGIRAGSFRRSHG